MPQSDGFLDGLLAVYLAREDPASIAFALSGLDPKLAGAILRRLPESQQGEAILRMASGRIETSLGGEKSVLLEDAGRPPRSGPAAAADILNRSGSSTEKAVLSYLSEKDPQLADEIRYRMYTFDEIARQTDEEIRAILSEVDPTHLATAMTRAGEAMSRRVFEVLDEEAGAGMRKRMASLGEVPARDVEDLQRRIVQTVRQLEELGIVRVVRGEL